MLSFQKKTSGFAHSVPFRQCFSSQIREMFGWMLHLHPHPQRPPQKDEGRNAAASKEGKTQEPEHSQRKSNLWRLKQPTVRRTHDEKFQFSARNCDTWWQKADKAPHFPQRSIEWIQNLFLNRTGSLKTKV